MREPYNRSFMGRAVALLVLLGILASEGILAAGSTEDLAKAAQNPVASMISLPLQNNTSFNLGPDDRTQNVLNIQPVIPVSLNDDWNLITRTIIPVVSQPVPGGERSNGIGDTLFTAFLSPAKPGKVIWGLGPVVQMPTASNRSMGNDTWGLGLSGVALTMPGRWVIGALVNNVWGLGSHGKNDQNLMTLQYFINYNFDKGWYLSSAPIITADWNQDSADRWVVPFGGGVGKIFKVGHQPMNAQVHAYYNARKPDQGADWSLRLQVQWLFPK